MSAFATDAGPRWFRRYARTTSAFRLFCFPHAGGSASMYRNWHDWLAPDIDVIAVELPGRGVHITEAPVDCLDVLVGRLLPAMRPLLDRPFALFGHSLGAIVAFELCRRLAEIEGPEPRHLIVSGMAAPERVRHGAPIHHLPDDEFVAALQRLNGTPPEILSDPGLIECLIDMLRADFRMAETYRSPGRIRLPCPITAFGGVSDTHWRRDDLEAWQHYTADACVVRWLPGDHFFLREQEHVVAAALAGLAADGRGAMAAV